MGAAISSFVASFGQTFKQPKYLAAVAVSAIAYFVLAAVTNFIPFVGQLLFAFVVVPLLNAGIIGVAYAVNEFGDSPLNVYTDSLKDNALSMIGAYLLSSIITGILVTILTIVMFIIGALIGAGIFSQLGNPEQFANDPQALAGALAGQLLVFVALFFIWFILVAIVGILFQFIGPAVVVGGRSATSAVSKSVGVFTSNPLSVIGYSLLRGFSFFLLMSIPFALIVAGGAASAGTTAPAGPGAAPPNFNTGSPLVMIGGLLALIFLPLGYAFFMMYHTTYYYEVTDGDPEGGQPTGAGAGAAPGGQQGVPGGQRGQQAPGGQQPHAGQQAPGARGGQQAQHGRQGQQAPGGQQPRGGQGGQPRGGHGGQQPRTGQGGQPQGGHGSQQPQGGQQQGSHPQGGQHGQPRGGQGQPGNQGQPGSQPQGGHGGRGGQPQGGQGNQPGGQGEPGSQGGQPRGGQGEQGGQPGDVSGHDQRSEDQQGRQSNDDGDNQRRE